jgi:hypothetical protein
MSSVKGQPTLVELSWAQATEQDIEKVAKRSGLTPDRIRQYLESDEQDNNILRHFAFFAVYPTGKLTRPV